MKSTLTEFEIRELILKYQSELKKLNYQVDVLERLINNLENSVGKVSTNSKEADIIDSVSKSILVKTEGKKKVPGKLGKSKVSKTVSPSVKTEQKNKGKVSKKGKTPATAKQKTAPKAGKIVAKAKATLQKGKKVKAISTEESAGYKLSTWDKLVIESITHAQKALTTYEIVDYLRSQAKNYKLSDNETLVKNKVVRSLQKLANRRKDIAKANYKGKGYVYGLPPWVDEQGKLDKRFK